MRLLWLILAAAWFVPGVGAAILMLSLTLQILAGTWTDPASATLGAYAVLLFVLAGSLAGLIVCLQRARIW